MAQSLPIRGGYSLTFQSEGGFHARFIPEGSAIFDQGGP